MDMLRRCAALMLVVAVVFLVGVQEVFATVNVELTNEDASVLANEKLEGSFPAEDITLSFKDDSKVDISMTVPCEELVKYLNLPKQLAFLAKWLPNLSVTAEAELKTVEGELEFMLSSVYIAGISIKAEDASYVVEDVVDSVIDSYCAEEEIFLQEVSAVNGKLLISGEAA